MKVKMNSVFTFCISSSLTDIPELRLKLGIVTKVK
jgi:hypothetical protein